MKVIVGLGNPGEKYANTRHNLGFITLDALLKNLESVKKTAWDEDNLAKAQIKNTTAHDIKLLLVKPQTFMNNSGQAVTHLVNYYKINSDDIIVIYDDLDLPLGKIRTRFGGAAGGHKGVESIINSLGTDRFLRIRLGIGHPHHHEGKEGKSYLAVEDYVLQPFPANEKSKVRHMIKEASTTIDRILEHGLELYMSKYHKLEGDHEKGSEQGEE